jgi:uncharacterized membrane protein YphA (DoxX/SURF4 family)
METGSRKLPNGVLWGLQILVAAIFFVSGAAKLVGAQMMVKAFEGIGIGQWFRYTTGIIEIGSAALLIVPGYASFGSALLVPTMMCAALAHIFVIGGSPIPALVLLTANAIILLQRWT